MRKSKENTDLAFAKTAHFGFKIADMNYEISTSTICLQQHKLCQHNMYLILESIETGSYVWSVKVQNDNFHSPFGGKCLFLI